MARFQLRAQLVAEAPGEEHQGAAHVGQPPLSGRASKLNVSASGALTNESSFAEVEIHSATGQPSAIHCLRDTRLD